MARIRRNFFILAVTLMFKLHIVRSTLEDTENITADPPGDAQESSNIYQGSPGPFFAISVENNPSSNDLNSNLARETNNPVISELPEIHNTISESPEVTSDFIPVSDVPSAKLSSGTDVVPQEVTDEETNIVSANKTDSITENTASSAPSSESPTKGILATSPENNENQDVSPTTSETVDSEKVVPIIPIEETTALSGISDSDPTVPAVSDSNPIVPIEAAESTSDTIDSATTVKEMNVVALAEPETTMGSTQNADLVVIPQELTNMGTSEPTQKEEVVPITNEEVIIPVASSAPEPEPEPELSSDAANMPELSSDAANMPENIEATETASASEAPVPEKFTAAAIFGEIATEEIEPLSTQVASTASSGVPIVFAGDDLPTTLRDEEAQTSQPPMTQSEAQTATNLLPIAVMLDGISDAELESTTMTSVSTGISDPESVGTTEKPVDAILLGGVPILIGDEDAISTTMSVPEMKDTSQPPDWLTSMIDGLSPSVIDDIGTAGTEIGDAFMGLFNVTANDTDVEMVPGYPFDLPTEEPESTGATESTSTIASTQASPTDKPEVMIIPWISDAMNETNGTESISNETGTLSTHIPLLEDEINALLENMTDINETTERPSELSKSHEDLTQEEQINAVTVVFLIPVHMKADVYWYEERNQKFRRFVAEAVNHHEAHGWNNLYNGSQDSSEGKEYLSRAKRNTAPNGILPEDLVYIAPSPSSENRTIYVAFFVRNSTSEDPDSLVPSYKVIHALKMSKWNLEETMGMNVTRIYQGIVLVKLEPFFVRHALIFTILLAIAVASICIIIIGLIYIRCRSTRGKWDRNDYCDKHKLKKDMRVSGEIGDLTPEEDIRRDERQMSEKDGVPYLNGSGIHVIPMNDDEGWVVPYDELSPEEKDMPEVEDTKL